MKITPLVLLALMAGILLGAFAVRPAAADGADDLHRSREALERIATALEHHCAR